MVEQSTADRWVSGLNPDGPFVVSVLFHFSITFLFFERLTFCRLITFCFSKVSEMLEWEIVLLFSTDGYPFGNNESNGLVVFPSIFNYFLLSSTIVLDC